MSFWSRLFGPDHKPRMGGLEIFKYIGPGLLVTVGFIDPGNWASNLAAGAQYGYTLLWMVTLSTVMLIVLQHNVAHLGIATGLCLSEAASAYLKPAWSRPLLGSAVLASISTSLAEILGGAIALQMLFGVPVLGSLTLLGLLTTLFITTNLSIGYTFSTIVQNQLQAMQLSMMFFLPSILLSGFMFPFAGMPVWAQYIGEGLPLTHFVRIVRAIMLKGAAMPNLQYDTIALVALMLFAMTIAVTRFRRTLD